MLLEVAINPTIDPVDRSACSPQAKQLSGRECNPTHQQIIGLKLYWAMICPPEQDPVFPTVSPCHRAPYPSLLASLLRGQTEKAKRATVPQWLEQKPHYRKLIRMKSQKDMSQNKGQDKTPERQLNEVEIGILPEKEFRITIVKMMQDLGGIMEKRQEMFSKDLEELKNKQQWIIH